jgi:hypothetical protein
VLFRNRTIWDTAESIIKFFEKLPDIEAIDVRVREPFAPNRLILIGTANRDQALATRWLVSPGTLVRMMVLRWVLSQPAKEFGTPALSLGMLCVYTTDRALDDCQKS